jgi:hypothetical protein
LEHPKASSSRVFRRPKRILKDEKPADSPVLAPGG